MARRKATEDVEVAAPVLPERLRECFVEDWIDVDHIPARYSKAGDKGEVIWYLMFHARGIWRDARFAWADEHGLDHREFGPVSRPRFRGGAQELIDAVGPRLICEG